MKDLIQRLKVDIAEESGTSPAFLQDLQTYMNKVETFAKNVHCFCGAFPNACFVHLGSELKLEAEKFL